MDRRRGKALSEFTSAANVGVRKRNCEPFFRRGTGRRCANCSDQRQWRRKLARFAPQFTEALAEETHAVWARESHPVELA